MQQFRVVEAISAYQEGHLDVPQAAEQARLPVAVFLEEMAMEEGADQGTATERTEEAIPQEAAKKLAELQFVMEKVGTKPPEWL